MTDIISANGLHTVVAGESPNVDIIAVHGLASNPAWTWCKEFKETEDSAREDVGHLNKESGLREVRWLTDLLPSVIPSARILIFNYQSAWLMQAPKEHLRSLSTRLLQAIHDMRHREGDTKDRPIIFIGHSFGGILIEDALVRSHHHRETELLQVASKTCGVVFLGTPLRGAKDASLATTMAYCATALGSDTGLLKILESDSRELSNLLQDFCGVVTEVYFEVVCFYETQAMSMFTLLGVNMKSSLIVPEGHATIDGYKRLSLPANHSTINKYDSSTNECFLMVSSQLKAISDNADRIVNQTGKRKRGMHFFVSYSKNLAFTPRDVVAQEIDRLLAGREVDEQIRIAIHGLGGAGKTQIALNLAYTNKKAFNIYWVNGNSIESFTARYSAIAQLAQLEMLTQGMKPNEVCLAVKKWLELEDSGNWLLFVDNADQLTDIYVESIQSYLPRSKGVIFFTSRDGSISNKLVRPEFCVELEAAMTEDEAITTFKSVALGRCFDHIDIKQIIQRLDHLPLAIIQAAAYIRENRVTIAGYLENLEKSEAKLLAVPLQEVDEIARAVMTTWNVSYDYIRSQNTSATDLLDIMSYLDFQEIQRTLLRSRPEELIAIKIIDDIDFDVAIGLLQSFALVSSTRSFSSYRIHRLVSSWTRQNIKSDAIKTALQIVLANFDEYAIDRLLEYEAFLLHVETVLRHTVNISKLKDTRDKLLFNAANYYQDAGKWLKSGRYFRECLLFRETHFGIEHPSTLDTVHNIASVYDHQGRYEEALEWYRRSLAGNEKALGKEHPSTLHMMYSLGAVYESLKDYEQSLEYYKAASQGYENTSKSDYKQALLAKASISHVKYILIIRPERMGSSARAHLFGRAYLFGRARSRRLLMRKLASGSHTNQHRTVSMQLNALAVKKSGRLEEV